jgi:hypothetical protein
MPARSEDIHAVRRLLDQALRHVAQLETALVAAPGRVPRGARGTSSLHLALVAAQKTRGDVSHLTSIPLARLDALCGGCEPTATERAQILAILPGFRG